MSNFQRVIAASILLGIMALGYSAYRWVWANYTSLGRLCTKRTETEAEVYSISEPYDIKRDMLSASFSDRWITASFEIKYKFTIAGTSFSGVGETTNVSGTKYEVYKQSYTNGPLNKTEELTFDKAPKVGDRLKIIYDPSDPKNNQPPEKLKTQCGTDPYFKETTAKIVLGLVITILVSAGIKSVRYTKRFGIKPAGDVLRKDTRPPVLYLRPFEFHDISTKATTVRTQPSAWLPFGMSIESASYEEALASVLHEVGPCITVSEPGREKPVVGFSRLKLADDKWQSEVEDLLRRSALVLLCSGSSPGIKWELEKAAAFVPRQRLVILITSKTSDEWWTDADKIFKCELPRITSDPKIALTGLIYFDATGKPAFDTLLGYDSIYITREIRKALRPVLRSVANLRDSTP